MSFNKERRGFISDVNTSAAVRAGVETAAAISFSSSEALAGKDDPKMGNARKVADSILLALVIDPILIDSVVI